MMDLENVIREFYGLVASINHMLANQANVVQLYVELDNRMRKDPAWVSRSLLMMLEHPDTDVTYSATRLAECRETCIKIAALLAG